MNKINLYLENNLYLEGELWIAQNLFYEDLNTGLESFTPVITKIDSTLFENVGSVLASRTVRLEVPAIKTSF